MPCSKLQIAAILLLCLPGVAVSQQVDVASDTENSSESWKAYCRHRAGNEYEFAWSVAPSQLVLKSNAIANWTNPLERGQINGSTFIWEQDGRPIVVRQLFSYLTGNDNRSLCHVFSTLTDQQVVGKRNGEAFWKPMLSDETGWHRPRNANF